MLTTVPPTAHLENSNGDISATGHLIHFVLGSRVGFLGTVDRMALFLVQ